MSTDGVLGAVYLPTDGWLDPSGLALALAAGARGPRRADPDRTPGSWRSAGARPRHRRDRRARRRAIRDPGRRRGQRRRHVRARRSAGWPASTCRSSRWPTSTCSPSRSRASTPGLPQLRDPDNLVYFREEVGGLCMGGYERHPAPWSLDGDPARLQRQAAGARLAALRRDHGRRGPAGAGDRRRRDQPDDQRPGGVHPGQRVHPRRERGPRLLRGRRVLRARHRRRGRDRPPDGDLDRRRRARARPVEDGHPPVRVASTAARPTRSPARPRSTRPTTTSTTRTRSARPAGRSGLSPTYDGSWPGSARSFGEKSGWERPELVRVERGRRRRGAPAARLGRAALVAGDRRRGAGDPARRRPVRRDVLRQDRGRRAGRAAVPPGRCAPTTSTGPVGSVVYTQLLDRRGGIEAT